MSNVNSSEDQLEVLRHLDTHRKWYSLDDKRVCVLCERIITGREITVNDDGNGKLSLRCPTAGCGSTPDAWFYHASACAGAPGLTTETSEFSFL